MFELVATGSQPGQRFRHRVRPEQVCTIGRGPDCDFVTAWDNQISRRHVEIHSNDQCLRLQRLKSAQNGVFVDGEEVDSRKLRLGDSFVIGHTTFAVTSSNVGSTDQTEPLEAVVFNSQDLQDVRLGDADRRIDVLAKLPEVIREARVDSELFQPLSNLILAGVVAAEAVAIVRLDPVNGVERLHWDRRHEAAGDVRPSARLVMDAIRNQQNVLHVWHAHNEASEDYTQVAGFDWAFCTPVPGDEHWGLYVAGRAHASPLGVGRRASDALELQGDVKFTEIVAEIISSVRRETRLERQQAGLRQFFAAPVLSLLGDDPNNPMLVPRECDVTVLFCDLRGFSHRTEAWADNLTKLLDRVGSALELMTDQILEFGGVPGDFQGDAALGFWGWPFQSDDAPVQACRAALGIRAAFDEARQHADHPLADFEMGIGVAHGRAVAGKIRAGTNRFTITVLGPVVNLASRLESMTKQLRVPILLDEAIPDIVRDRLMGIGRTRKLARVLPYGTETPVLVSELLPPESENSELTADLITEFELGVDHFIDGDWEQAWARLHRMPASDRAQDFLSMQITRHNRTAPGDWDGVVKLSEK